MKLVNFAILLSLSLNVLPACYCQNLVPNSSFEINNCKYDSSEKGKAKKCNIDIATYWTTPTEAKPIIYSFRDSINISKSGLACALIYLNTWNKDDGKCEREYIQVPLKEKLKSNNTYEISIHVSIIKTLHDGIDFEEIYERSTMKINQLACLLTENKIREEGNGLILAKPQINFVNTATGIDEHGWIQLTSKYTSKGNEKYLIVGNFNNCKTNSQSLSASILIDDVSIMKSLSNNIQKAEIFDLSKLMNRNLYVGESFVLSNVYFDFASEKLQQNSFTKLNNVIKLLELKPELKIEIIGHTDSIGTMAFNTKLSILRARSIVQYLVQHGILTNRLGYSGFGSSQPLTDNETDEGRIKNRRVELIVKK
ncbi:MAG: hypothetical protein COC01_01690 [Bacteroidetes bacterium]|nr:OmpA family protein [Bacteroidia bacterium]PCH69347.1 MAG: hypothetical protein COC01_01690 [Bacteroidota bacterium]